MRVKEILKEKGIAAKELAAKIGMTETGLSIAISEKGNPPLKRLQDIASALDVSVAELFEPQDPSQPTGRCPHCGKPIKIKFEE